MEVCPICREYRAQLVGSGNKGFSLGKATLGAVVLGPVGVVGGLAGKKMYTYHCSQCNYTFERKK